MLESLKKLAQLDDSENYIPVDYPSISNIVYLMFERENQKMAYVGCDSEQCSKTKFPQYLYKRDLSGKPGLFLCGKINFNDIKNVKTLFEKNKDLDQYEVQNFIKKKVFWITKNKLRNNTNLYSTLDKKHQNLLTEIFDLMHQNKKKITSDVIKLLTDNKTENILFTIKIDGCFPGEKQSLQDFFTRGVLDKKSKNSEFIICYMCNMSKMCGIFRETPLPFYITDKPTFFSNAKQENALNGFPLCDDCYIDIKKATNYIKSHLTYSLPSTKKAQSKLKFWLIPHVYDQTSIKEYETSLNSKLLTSNLRDLVSKIEGIEHIDRINSSKLDFIRFSCVFFVVDEHGIMRVLRHINGIYPSHLKELVEIKKKVDNNPITRQIRKSLDEKLYFGFPSLVDVYDDLPQWRSQLITLLENIFLGYKVDIEQFYNIVNVGLVSFKSDEKNSNSKSDLKSLTITVMQRLILIEYLISLNQSIKNKGIRNDSQYKR